MIERVGSQASERRTERSDDLNPLSLRSGRFASSASQPRASQVIPPNPTRPARSHYCRQHARNARLGHGLHFKNKRFVSCSLSLEPVHKRKYIPPAAHTPFRTTATEALVMGFVEVSNCAWSRPIGSDCPPAAGQYHSTKSPPHSPVWNLPDRLFYLFRENSCKIRGKFIGNVGSGNPISSKVRPTFYRVCDKQRPIRST